MAASRGNATSDEVLRYFEDEAYRIRDIARYKDVFRSYCSQNTRNVTGKRAFGENADMSEEAKVRAKALADSILIQAFGDYHEICNSFDEEKIDVIAHISSPHPPGPVHIAPNAELYCELNITENEDGEEERCNWMAMRSVEYTPAPYHPGLNITHLRAMKLSELQDIQQVTCMQTSTRLIISISNTEEEQVIALIGLPELNINKYSVQYGNTAILLAISKGWNHVRTDTDATGVAHVNPQHTQQAIIRALLSRPDIEINCVHLLNGMTPLHIACLRGDSPELIRLLLEKGADKDARDYSGKTPFDYLDESYDNVKINIMFLTTDWIDEEARSAILQRLAAAGPRRSLVLHDYATLPTEAERATNVAAIKQMLRPAAPEAPPARPRP
jgi:hypothetical protein